MAVYKTGTAEETKALGQRLAAALRPGSVIAFTGGLGAGKTTLCRGIAAGLGCIDEASSPTYAIVNLYRGPQPFAHFDLYRLETAEELDAAGFYEYLDTGAVLAVEWSERFSLPVQPDVCIDIAVAPDGTREITVEGVAL